MRFQRCGADPTHDYEPVMNGAPGGFELEFTARIPHLRRGMWATRLSGVFVAVACYHVVVKGDPQTISVDSGGLILPHFPFSGLEKVLIDC